MVCVYIRVFLLLWMGYGWFNGQRDAYGRPLLFLYLSLGWIWVMNVSCKGIQIFFLKYEEFT